MLKKNKDIVEEELLNKINTKMNWIFWYQCNAEDKLIDF